MTDSGLCGSLQKLIVSPSFFYKGGKAHKLCDWLSDIRYMYAVHAPKRSLSLSYLRPV